MNKFSQEEQVLLFPLQMRKLQLGIKEQGQVPEFCFLKQGSYKTTILLSPKVAIPIFRRTVWAFPRQKKNPISPTGGMEEMKYKNDWG